MSDAAVPYVAFVVVIILSGIGWIVEKFAKQKIQIEWLKYDVTRIMVKCYDIEKKVEYLEYLSIKAGEMNYDEYKDWARSERAKEYRREHNICAICADMSKDLKKDLEKI